MTEEQEKEIMRISEKVRDLVLWELVDESGEANPSVALRVASFSSYIIFEAFASVGPEHKQAIKDHMVELTENLSDQVKKYD